MDIESLKDEFEAELEQELTVDYAIGARRCSSDRFDGVEFEIEAEYVPIAPILDVLRAHDKLFAEQIGATPETNQSRVVVFVVEHSLNPTGKATLSEME